MSTSPCCGGSSRTASAIILFNIQNPEGTVKAVAESAMREVIGRSNIQPILTGARTTTEAGGAGPDAEDARQLRLRHSGAAGADAEGRSAGAGDRCLPRRAGRARRPRAVAERSPDLCQPRRSRRARTRRADPAGRRRLQGAGGRRSQGPERALPQGLRRIQEGAGRHPAAHLSGDHGAHSRQCRKADL